MTVYTPDPSYTEQSYAGPAVVAAGAEHGTMVFNVFRTSAPVIKGAVLFCMGGGFRGISLPSTVDDSVADTGANYFQLVIAAMIASGWDIFFYALPPARDAAGDPAKTANLVEDVTLDMDNWTGTGVTTLGPMYARGHGMFVLSDDPTSPTLPAGYAGPLHPMQDPGRPSWMQGHVMAMQYVANNRATLGWSGKPLVAFGGSATAIAASYTAYGPDRAPYTFPGGTGQDAVSTRGLVSAVMLNAWQTWIPAWATTTYLSGVPDDAKTGGAWATATAYVQGNIRTNGGTVYQCYTDHTSGAANEPGVGASWEDFWFAKDLNIQADTIAAAPAGSLEALSALSYIDGAAEYAENKQIPTLLLYSDGTSQTGPYDDTVLNDATVSTHDDYFGAAAQLLLGANCKLLLTNPSGGQAAAFSAAGVQFEIIAAGASVSRNKQMAWLENTYRALTQTSGMRSRWMPPRRPHRLLGRNL